MKNINVYLGVIFLILLTTGCNKATRATELKKNSNLQGTYKGVFTDENKKKAPVNIKLFDTKFSGYSETSPDFPTVRFGTYIVNSQEKSITFINESVVDDQNKKSYVLNGHWKYSLQDTLLMLNNDKDQEYKLYKKSE